MVTPVLLGAVLLLLAVGWVVIGRARRSAASGAYFLRTAASARADVVDVRERYARRARSEAMPTYFPVVAFALPDGRMVESEVMVGARPKPARVGASVEVRYDPADPRRVVLARGMATVGAVGCFATGLGVAFWVLAAVLLMVWVLLKLVLQMPG